MDSEVIRYGVIGFSKNQFDKESAYTFLDELFRHLKEEHSNKTIEIVSGYTNSGVPKIAYELADKYGFTTVGFSARQALSVESGTYPVMKVILKGEQFGDESHDFIEYIDKLIRVGGGLQSKKEIELFKEKESQVTTDSMLIEYEVNSY